MASAMAGLLPDTQGVQFTARPILRTRENISPVRSFASSRGGRISSNSLIPGEGGEYIPRGNLSTIEVESLMREKVRSKYDSLKQAFQMYDVDQNETVTKGEFRRVLESYCFPMNTEQFNTVLNKVDKTHSGSIKYVDFLQKFYGAGNQSRLRPVSAFILGSGPGAPREVNMDVIERLLRDKISQNLKSVVRGMQLFDYNMDGKIQRHELRRVLENYCFKFTDTQFDKLWLRYDFHHTGLVNYRDFLQRLGVNAKLQGKPPANNAAGALKWPAVVNQQQHQALASQFASTRVREQHKQDEALLQVLNFDQIEIEFRSRMRDNYQRLKKAFMALDRHLDGFVTIEDLRAILSNFTLPMSDQLFAQLMARCGVRGTNRVAWELFLEKFQNPVAVGNGQTIPIQPNHKFHPVMETQEAVSWDAIWRQLYKHVQNGYSSMKQAFLQFDKNRDGKVTKKEFRQIIEKFTFRLEDSQFKEMMSRLNLSQGPRVSYHDFLDIFEEKESLKEGHKWLKSVHRFNDKPKPAIMAWETVEDLLQEKITQYWKNVAENLMQYDVAAKGYVTPKQMKRVIDRQVMPISDDHYAHLLERCEDRTEGKVNYVEFLTKLKVDVRPGDLVGLSTQIMDSSGRAEMRRQTDQYVRQQMIDDNAVSRTHEMTAEEVIIRIKDKMSQHTSEIRKAFLSCDKKGKGRITKRQFREILANLGMLMTDQQYEELMSRLHLHNGHMEYMDFVLNFGDPRPTDASNLIRNGNHRVNPIRGDQFGMTAEEVENKLRSKLRENFANLRGAFYKFDDNHSGCLTKKNFRRMLDSFMIVMSDEEYEKMCERHGITKSTRISYREFLERFEVRDTAEGHKWLNSVHRYNETFPPKPLTAEEAHQTLKEKAYRQWNDLAKAFRQIDSKGNGIISRRELRDLLYRFVMPMNDDDFKKLWARYDEEGKGFISHSDFLEHLGAPEHAPGDFVGPSQRIIDGSRFNIELHNTLQQQRHEGITQKQANLTEHMSATEVIRQLKDKIRDSYADLYKAFCKYDTQNRGSLSVHDIQKVLVEQNFYITDEEFFLLLDMIGLRTDKARLNYSQFLAAFEDGRKSSYGRRPAEVRIEEYTELTAEDAENKLRQKLEKNIDDVSRTLAAIDKGETGRVLVDELRRILDLYCFRMTTDQWRRVKARMSIGPDNCVDYASFLRNYIGNEHMRFDQAVQALQDAPPLPVYQLVTVDEVQERIQEAVRSHQPTIVRDLKDADYAGIGSVSRDAFREILNKHVMRLNDEQFERVWDLSPVNEYGNINYRDFLANYSDDVRIPSPPRTANPDTNRRPYTSMSVRPGSRMNLQRPASQMSRSYSRANSRCATPLVNAESAEQRLKDKVFRHWKDMQRQCRNLDHHNTGTISVSEFGDLLSQYNIDLPPQDFDSIVTKYDMKENGRFSYSEFLRHFMISMRPKDGSAITARKKLQPLRVPMEIQEEGSDLLTRVSECVSSNWKDMRREFKAVDQDGMGIVNELEFRRILRQFCANVSEEEFDTIVTTFDRTANGLVSYNDFVRKFIH
ncbi:EF-hand calcium-binding domain-containing protein 6-like [Littorina saxatilis]|uniref:EF-hand calcium-binding domain-containing protein 6-like n=1 Tax=Littorina saxatilis TaxID=31220 RepID=UPI0038B42F43